MNASLRKVSTLFSALILASASSSFVQSAPVSEPNIATIAKLGATGGTTSTANCSAESSWFTSPSMPSEVKTSDGPGDSSFCDFYQFSWQTFAYLMAESKNDPSVINFQDNTQFNQLELNLDGSPANSCDDKHDSQVLFIRTAKHEENGTDIVIPEMIGQAGGGATIYDQNGNVVYYDVRFSKNMCNVKAIQQLQNFPAGTTEMKTAWKVLGENDDPNDFITMDANITPVVSDQSNTKKTKLGMIGFHVAVATQAHPEFVWATFEHKVNSPDCTLPQETTGWSFASQECSAGLKNNQAGCEFNNPTKQSKVTGKPTQICRMYPYGSSEGDLKFQDNVDSIKSLNANVQPYLNGNFEVLKNYFNVGALWVSDINKGSYTTPTNGQAVTQISNQRGSLRLANTVAETEYQEVNTAAINLNGKSSPSAGFVSNCFGCHNYEGLDSNISNTTSNSLSHIFDDIAVGSKQCLDVQAANIINSNTQAKADCPTTCSNSSSKLKWNGQWTNQNASTGAQLAKSVCGCCAN
ncbi:mannan-binding lectin [Shewanella kaireitica]|uniref:mannan-binding lectin n=1 Tax=Shewanella kaireitica TaxID=212021 RepID=UPI00200C1A39|nr:mannan-binding lectin [Shewanella kaireitica]MCL1094066.1 mannan-binding lectin [Shewanella kaireitica]